MKTMLTFLLLFLTLWLHAAEPFCIVRTFDERDGLSQSLVKQVAADADGIIWVATWNGLNRFDGYEFVSIRPPVDNETRRYSSRIGDIKADSRGRLWMRIDSHMVTLNTADYSFDDIHSRLEKQLGRRFSVDNIISTTDGLIVLQTKDGGWITVGPDDTPRLSSSRPVLDLPAATNRGRLPADAPAADIDAVYIGGDDHSGTWIIKRNGEIVHSAPGPWRPVTLARLETRGTLFFGMKDRLGNLWLRSNAGLHRVTLGVKDYHTISSPTGSMMRTAMNGPGSRLWVSWSDAGQVAIYPPSLSSPRWLTPDGSLAAEPATLGIPVYSMASTGNTVWLGSKPDGLYRLTPADADASRYRIDHVIADDAIYDIKPDSRGRLWLASMLHGVEIVTDPLGPNPRVTRLSDIKGYPSNAIRVRRLVIVGDSVAFAATTGGLLAISIPPAGKEFGPESFKLYVSEPGRPESLGNVAVTDIDITSRGRLMVATESDGINHTPLGTGRGIFSRFNRDSGAPTDVAYNVMTLDTLSNRVLATSNRFVYIFDPDSATATYLGPSFFNHNINFSDARPLRLADGSYLFGLTDGAVTVDIDKAVVATTTAMPIVFTSVSFPGKPSQVLPPSATTMTIDPDNRNFTLEFARLEYVYPELIRYSACIDGGRWIDLGNDRDITFANIAPGRHTIAVRSTDSRGNLLPDERTMTIEVTPTFSETPWAKALVILAVIAVAWAIVATVGYTRRLRLKQRMILDAYLDLLQQNSRRAMAETPAGDPAQSVAETPPPTEREQAVIDRDKALEEVDENDRRMLDRVVKWVEEHLDDTTVSVDDMADAAATSRSGLTRKMKQIMGITPAEFLKASRLAKAEQMLAETTLSVKEIAAATGFSDMNYFGKCFKARHSMTPTDYRRSHSSQEPR